MPKQTPTFRTLGGRHRRLNTPTDEDGSKGNPLELKKKSLNVSGGREFYERASSRRERHRNALRASLSMDEAVPLGRGGAKGPGLAVDMVPAQQDEDDDDVTKRLNIKAQKRIHAIAAQRKVPRASSTSLLPPHIPNRKRTEQRSSHLDRYDSVPARKGLDHDNLPRKPAPTSHRRHSDTTFENRKKRRFF